MNDKQELTLGIELACTPQNVGRIMAGRERVLAMDRVFVLQNIETVARQCLDVTDYWEYSRFLELCDLLDNALVQRVVEWGADSTDVDVREASTDFRRNTEQVGSVGRDTAAKP